MSIILKCSKCNYEHARVEQSQNGRFNLTVKAKPLQLTVLDKENKKGALSCPNCNNVDPVSLEYFEGF